MFVDSLVNVTSKSDKFLEKIIASKGIKVTGDEIKALHLTLLICVACANLIYGFDDVQLLIMRSRQNPFLIK